MRKAIRLRLVKVTDAFVDVDVDFSGDGGLTRDDLFVGLSTLEDRGGAKTGIVPKLKPPDLLLSDDSPPPRFSLSLALLRALALVKEPSMGASSAWSTF